MIIKFHPKRKKEGWTKEVKENFSRLSIEEVRNKYLNYKLNGGELNWNDFQKKIKEDTIDI